MILEDSSYDDCTNRKAIFLFLFWSFAITWACIFPALRLQETTLTATFLVFTFRVSPSSILSFIGNLGPAAGAVVVLAGRNSRQELKNLFREIFAVRISFRHYLLAVVIPCLVLSLAVIGLLLSSGIKFFHYPGALGMWLDLLIFGGLLRAAGEEIGWRGFLLPRLQERMSGLEAASLVGLVWWTWHLPVRIDPAPAFHVFGHLVYLADVLSLSIILAWLRNSTKGSLVPVTVFHAAFNAGLGTLHVPDDRWISSRWNFCLASTLLLAAGLVLVISGKDLRAARRAN